MEAILWRRNTVVVFMRKVFHIRLTDNVRLEYWRPRILSMRTRNPLETADPRNQYRSATKEVSDDLEV